MSSNTTKYMEAVQKGAALFNDKVFCLKAQKFIKPVVCMLFGSDLKSSRPQPAWVPITSDVDDKVKKVMCCMERVVFSNLHFMLEVQINGGGTVENTPEQLQFVWKFLHDNKSEINKIKL